MKSSCQPRPWAKRRDRHAALQTRRRDRLLQPLTVVGIRPRLAHPRHRREPGGTREPRRAEDPRYALGVLIDPVTSRQRARHAQAAGRDRKSDRQEAGAAISQRTLASPLRRREGRRATGGSRVALSPPAEPAVGELAQDQQRAVAHPELSQRESGG